MTHKNFEIIAEIMRDSRPRPGDSNSGEIVYTLFIQWERTLDAMCARFKLVNPSFNPEEFRKACHSRNTT